MQNYKLLTPGPLTTSDSVKQAMLHDHCTWDDEYKKITNQIRIELLRLAGVDEKLYTSVLIQGSGSFAVESVLTSICDNHKVLILINGVYGYRAMTMLKYAKISYIDYTVDTNTSFDLQEIEHLLQHDSDITHIFMVHCETTTGILNEIYTIGLLSKQYNKILIVDAMSSFGGIPISVPKCNIDFLISSANKCIQGVPGFAFVIAKKTSFIQSKGKAKSLSLDLYEQWQEMEHNHKWRFTSPTHSVLAFYQALKELREEGGIYARYKRYKKNNQLLRDELAKIGIQAYISPLLQSPFITTFLFPQNKYFDFVDMYNFIKAKGYVIYPGKLTDIDSFRLGNIGEIYEEDIYNISNIIKQYIQGL